MFQVLTMLDYSQRNNKLALWEKKQKTDSYRDWTKTLILCQTRQSRESRSAAHWLYASTRQFAFNLHTYIHTYCEVTILLWPSHLTQPLRGHHSTYPWVQHNMSTRKNWRLSWEQDRWMNVHTGNPRPCASNHGYCLLGSMINEYKKTRIHCLVYTN